METDYKQDLLLNAVKKLEREGDDYLFLMYRKYHDTKDKPLFWNFRIWYPVRHLISFFDVFKWTKEFPTIQAALLGFGGTLFGVKISEVKGYDAVSNFLKALNLESLDWGWYALAFLVVWYLLTINALQKAIVDPESPYFLYRAYRKWDASYKVFGALIESEEYEKLFADIVSQLSETPEISIDVSQLKELIAMQNEKYEKRDKELERKRQLLKLKVKQVINYAEIITEDEKNVHYKLLNVLDIPYILYKREGRSLIYQWSDGVIGYDPKISLRKKDDFFVKVYDNKGEAFSNHEFVGLRIETESSAFVLTYTVSDEKEIMKNKKIFINNELRHVLRTVLTSIETNKKAEMQKESSTHEK